MSSGRTAATRCFSASNTSAPPRSIAIAASPGAATVDRGLDALSLDDTLAFVRGFMLFSMLANLAEDRQGAGADMQATTSRTR